jgi:rhamnulokinase
MKESQTFLAIDLGAESGRAVLGRFDGVRLEMDEIHRFPNEPVYYNGGLHWDAPRLWLQIQRALHEATRNLTAPLGGIGVDGWGLDFTLLGEGGALLDNPYHYRDRRADGMIEEVCKKVPAHWLYDRTGVQFMQINSLYHLYAASRRTPGLLESAKKLLMVPDLMNFWLTGEAVCEYTNATTTQFLDLNSRGWAVDVLARLDIPTHFLADVICPGSSVGSLLPAFAINPRLDGCPVFAPATHDTGSAVASIAMTPRSAFISSGTWSLLGSEVAKPVTTARARQMNFTNEGGVSGTIRLLKNITGMWLLQGCRNSWEASGNHVDYGELVAEAGGATPLQALVDPDHPEFLHPPDMPEAIARFCKTTQQNPPRRIAEFARCVLESLALKYRYVLEALESITGIQYDEIRVVGGGARNRLLNQFTADATNRRVVAGPVEATALGNLAVQLVASKCVASLAEARKIIDSSFATETFVPVDPGPWQTAYGRFQQYCAVVN